MIKHSSLKESKLHFGQTKIPKKQAQGSADKHSAFRLWFLRMSCTLFDSHLSPNYPLTQKIVLCATLGIKRRHRSIEAHLGNVELFHRSSESPLLVFVGTFMFLSHHVGDLMAIIFSQLCFGAPRRDPTPNLAGCSVMLIIRQLRGEHPWVGLPEALPARADRQPRLKDASILAIRSPNRSS